MEAMHPMTDLDLDRRGHEARRLQASEGILSAWLSQGRLRSAMAQHERHEEIHGVHRKVHAGANIADANLVYGYAAAQTMVQVLKQAGDDLTRENVMKQAASLKDFAPDTRFPASRSTPAPPTLLRSNSSR